MRKKTKKRSSFNSRWRGASAAALAIAITLCSMLAPSAFAAEEESASSASVVAAAENLIERLISRYESEQSYRISFTQESYWALADTSISSSGVLLLERPALLSVSYEDGSSIVSNGDTLWVFTSQTNQYFSTRIDADDTVIDPPRVLRQYVPSPDGAYSARTEPSRDGEADPALREHAVTEATLKLVPADGAGEPSRLEVTVDPNRTIVTGMIAHTRSGDYTRYAITETVFGVETGPGDFIFEAPPGAERIGG